jgi:nucleoside 2-deoxyribosyltransferase
MIGVPFKVQERGSDSLKNFIMIDPSDLVFENFGDPKNLLVLGFFKIYQRIGSSQERIND